MNLSERIALLAKLGNYMLGETTDWQAAKERAYAQNKWFLPEFIELSVNNIARLFLNEAALMAWAKQYPALDDPNLAPKRIGIVMAGNIPLVGFHDFLCVFSSGHKAIIKPSSKDEELIKHLTAKLISWAPDAGELIVYADLLKHCDAYIATGSNSTANYFDYYFGKYPHIIRHNRTSVAILTGKETSAELELLAKDVFRYFGMGCRNITKLYVPLGYDFVPLINVFKNYDHLADHHKYKNNYDYNLALHILNNKRYMSTASLLMVEDKNIFSPVSQLNYEEYENVDKVISTLVQNPFVQCIVSVGHIAFGAAQEPALSDYADGVDTMAWLENLQ